LFFILYFVKSNIFIQIERSNHFLLPAVFLAALFGAAAFLVALFGAAAFLVALFGAAAFFGAALLVVLLAADLAAALAINLKTMIR
jgi:hypothetical protein